MGPMGGRTLIPWGALQWEFLDFSYGIAQEVGYSYRIPNKNTYSLKFHLQFLIKFICKPQTQILLFALTNEIQYTIMLSWMQ